MRTHLQSDPILRRETEQTLLRTRHFAEVSPELLHSVLDGASLLRVPAGQLLMRQGSRDSGAMYLLLEGELDVLDSGKFIVSISEPGEAIGELAAINHLPRIADVRTQTACSLVELPDDAIARMREADPERYIQFLQLTAQYLGGKLARSTRRVRTYEEVLLEREKLRTHSEGLEREVQRKLHEVLLYSHVIRSSQDGILIAEPDGAVVLANPAAVTLFDWKDWKPGAFSVYEILPQLAERRTALLSPTGTGFKAEWTLERTIHGRMPVEVTFTPVNEAGRVVSLAFFLRDIRGFQMLLETLEESEAQLSQYSRDLERTVGERTAELRESNEELQQSNAKLQHETEIKDAALRKLQETQSHLLQSEKMIGLGHLAAGVAHEINNPIGFVTSNLNTIAEYIEQFQALLSLYERIESEAGPAASPLLEEARRLKREMDYAFVMDDASQVVKDAREGAGRVAAIVRNLKDFTHLDEAQRQWVNVNEGLESTIKLIWNELKYKAKVEREFGDLPQVECQPQQLNQVFLNLLLNAVQAIEKEGTITVRTAAVPEGIVIEIEDTGSGIAPEHLAHIYEPFFTTKPIGTGMGLGLTSAYSIVRNHRGTIDVRSEPGAGTTFTVKLPRRQPPQPSASPEP